MSKASTEFEGIFAGTESRPVLSVPPRMRASIAFAREVRGAIGLDDASALSAADWIADKMERFGARSARPVFDMDGAGPQCSWCGAIWPLCGHHHLSEALDESDEE